MEWTIRSRSRWNGFRVGDGGSEAKRPRDAHGQLVRSWRSLFLDSGYSDHADGPIDQIAELLLQTSDLRGARFVAEDYGVRPYGAAKLANQMTLYCAILEASTGSLGERRGAATPAGCARPVRA